MSSLPEAELLSIAVNDQYQGSGVGRRLAEGILEGLARLGADQARVLVAASNTGANRFYERLGFRATSRIELHEGQSSNVLVARCRS